METRIKEKPILFNSEMVRAILSGQKTQVRKAIKNQNFIGDNGLINEDEMTRTMWRKVNKEMPESFGATFFCPHGRVGDRLWLRETFSTDAIDIYPFPTAWYKASDDLEAGSIHDSGCDQKGRNADCLACWEDENGPFRWLSPILMPMSLSRIMLEVVSVKVERLHSITEDDAKAEGVGGKDTIHVHEKAIKTYRKAFEIYWNNDYRGGNWNNKVHQGPYRWPENPWTWRLDFKMVY